ncbi:MAG: DUF4980 domain-containing protein [Chitinophagaceae bacterium]
MMKLLLTAFLFCSFLNFSSAQNNAAATRDYAQYFTAEKRYLVLPVKNGAPRKNIEIWVDGVNTRFFDMELADEKPDWYAYLLIDQWKGKQVEVRVEKMAVNSKAFSPITQSDEDKNANDYHEPLRAQFHFSPKRGWTNDPNGMVYYKGEYHLFFQHNPYGRGWGNMTWGHTVSKDLVHWKELDDAIHPDQGGPIFSGGAVVDVNNTSGLGTSSNPPMVVFHTGARGWAQYMSWSTDGRNFTTYDKAAVPRINKDNRDPKVIWYEPTKKWVMVFWVERGDNVQHSMQFLTSPDLKNWTLVSVVLGGIGNDHYLFECPEFYELPVEGQAGVKKWILVGANTEYAIGSFDGTTFTPEQQKLQGQYGRGYYAPQTFSDEPKGRRVEIGWWQTNTAIGDAAFNQSMSIPMEHKLVQTPDGIRLTRTPVKELEVLRDKAYHIGSISLKDNQANPLKDINIELAELQLTFEPGKAKEVTLNVRGAAVVYNAEKKILTVDGVTAPAATIDGKIKLVIYADCTGLEIFINNGLAFMPVNINLADSNRSLSLSATGGKIKVNNLDVYSLKSIW